MLYKKLGWGNHFRKKNVRFWNTYCSQIIFLRPEINTILNGESCIIAVANLSIFVILHYFYICFAFPRPLSDIFQANVETLLYEPAGR